MVAPGFYRALALGRGFAREHRFGDCGVPRDDRKVRRANLLLADVVHSVRRHRDHVARYQLPRRSTRPPPAPVHQQRRPVGRQGHELVHVSQPLRRHRALKHREHREREQRVVPVLVGEPEDAAKRLKHEKRRDELLTKKVPEPRPRHPQLVRAPLVRRRLRADVVVTRPRDVPSRGTAVRVRDGSEFIITVVFVHPVQDASVLEGQLGPGPVCRGSAVLAGEGITRGRRDGHRERAQEAAAAAAAVAAGGGGRNDWSNDWPNDWSVTSANACAPDAAAREASFGEISRHVSAASMATDQCVDRTTRAWRIAPAPTMNARSNRPDEAIAPDEAIPIVTACTAPKETSSLRCWGLRETSRTSRGLPPRASSRTGSTTSPSTAIARGIVAASCGRTDANESPAAKVRAPDSSTVGPHPYLQTAAERWTGRVLDRYPRISRRRVPKGSALRRAPEGDDAGLENSRELFGRRRA